jgi:dihydroxyacetone kinase-like protein
MKKIINKPDMYVDEMLDGLCMAHPSLVRTGDTRRVIARATGVEAGKVGIVSGGGSGHLPLFTGYVGEGLLDACAIGNVFEGPTVSSCGEAIRSANGGAGVLCLYGNYGGDRMNFDMACEMADLDDIPTRTVLGTDDVASAPPQESAKRRGVAGIVFAYKAAGAKAAERASLDDVAAAAANAVARTRTIGVALSACRIPTAARPSFEISDDDIEFGMGIHGEPGIWRDRLKSADELVDEMLTRILADKPVSAGKRVAVLVNSLGATPLEELFIMYRRLATRLSGDGYEIARSLVGHFVTSMEMAGASISICFLDGELETLLGRPAKCPFWSV